MAEGHEAYQCRLSLNVEKTCDSQTNDHFMLRRHQSRRRGDGRYLADLQAAADQAVATVDFGDAVRGIPRENVDGQFMVYFDALVDRSVVPGSAGPSYSCGTTPWR